MANVTSQDYLNHRMMTFTPDVPFDPDPWVKVGTTTIDGTPEQVASIFGCSVVDLCSTIDDSVWCIGGRSIRVAHWFGDPSAVMLHCDIVRRQSEIEAEARMRPCINCEEHLCDTQFCESCVEGFRAMEPPCPECGPHGNRGEVLLASSWAKCTTCAGGKSGDLWGEVKAEKQPMRIWGVDVNANPSYEELRTAMSSRLKDFEIACGMRGPDGRSFMDARREALAAHHGQGFKVPTLSEMYGAELDNLRRILCEPPDDVSPDEYRRIMFGEQV